MADPMVREPRTSPPRTEGLFALPATGTSSEPSMRDELLRLTMLEVARVGPAAFNTRTISTELGLTHPIIQYHFGSRDGLIAEAAHLVYRCYVTAVWAAVEAAPRTPVDRLRAALEAGVRLSVEMRGWGAVLNYFPSYSAPLADIVAERFQQQHEHLYLQNLTLLVQLIVDVWTGRVTDVMLADEPTAESAILMSALADPDARSAIGRLTFAMHGLSVWRAGHVLPAADGDAAAQQVVRTADELVASTIDDLVGDVVERRPRPAEQ